MVSAPASEAADLAAAQAGDAAAFGRLVRAHQGRVRRQLRRLCDGDAALADELAQEAFVQAWQALPGFRGQASLTTWLHRLAYTRFLMQRRADAARPASATDADPIEQAAPGAGGDPGALRLDLMRAVAALPADEHDALVHCLALELSLNEAAEVLGVPPDTLKSRLARARAKLRERLADWRHDRQKEPS